MSVCQRCGTNAPSIGLCPDCEQERQVHGRSKARSRAAALIARLEARHCLVCGGLLRPGWLVHPSCRQGAA